MFWRAWHRSFNRWLIRIHADPARRFLIFRSSRSAVRSVGGYLLIFTFVALRHDIQMRLLIWGWLIVLFMLPEFAGKYFFPSGSGDPSDGLSHDHLRRGRHERPAHDDGESCRLRRGLMG